MMLGDMLAEARRAAPGFRDRLRAVDPALAAEAGRAAAEAGEDLATFARAAVAAFARDANDEDWVRLAGRLHASAEPGVDCLRVMLRHRIAGGGDTDTGRTG